VKQNVEKLNSIHEKRAIGSEVGREEGNRHTHFKLSLFQRTVEVMLIRRGAITQFQKVADISQALLLVHIGKAMTKESQRCMVQFFRI